MNPKKTKNKNAWILTLGRIVVGGLFFFEAANWLGLLHFSLEFTWLGLMLTSGFVWIACELVIRKIPESALSLAARGLVFLGAAVPTYLDALGDMNRWYSGIDHYDKYLHFSGGAAACGVVAVMIYSHIKMQKSTFRLSPGWMAFFSFTTATFLGALYEMEEYLEDVFTGSHRSGGGPDTAGDLTCDVLGAAIIAIILWQVWNRKKRVSK